MCVSTVSRIRVNYDLCNITEVEVCQSVIKCDPVSNLMHSIMQVGARCFNLCKITEVHLSFCRGRPH